MNNYIIDFDYKGPKTNVPGSYQEADEALEASNRLVEQALDSLNLEWKHEYAWTDGSLYKKVTSSVAQDKLKVDLELKIQEINHNPNLHVRVVSIEICQK